MNKQKTLIFSLSAILFLALSFIAYSWTEPVANMPSEYTAPLNTSSTAQTKTGEIGASMFRDADNGKYYINPSGNSVISGTISVANPIENKHVTTKEYVDGLFSGAEQEISSSNLMYISGTNPFCSEGSVEIIRHYLSKTCGYDSLSCRPGLTSCQTAGDVWVTKGHIPSCTYRTTNNICADAYYATCVASDSDAVICAKVGVPLFGSYHTEEQCNIWGQPVIVEKDVKICKINSASCPGGWTQYKNWSTTVPGQSPFPISASAPSGPYYYTGSHAWSNTGIESLYCNRCIGTTSNNEFCGTNDYCSNYRYYYYASVTEIGCY